MTYVQPATISAWAALVSAVVALITVSVSLRRARRQIIAPMRLEWITTLRQHIAEFTAEATKVNRDYNFLGTDKLDDNLRKNILLLEHRIRLLLNPDEPAHRELLKALREIGEACLTRGLDDFRQLLEAAFECAQTVLRAEWRKVKELR